MLSPNKQLLYSIPLVASLGLAGTASYSQSSDENTRLDINRGDSARAYVEQLRFSRIEKDIFYIDELNRPIPMNGLPRYRPPDPVTEETDGPDIPDLSDPARWSYMALFAGIAIGIGFLAYRFGGGAGGSFRKTADGKAASRDRHRIRPAQHAETTPTGILLDRLRAMEDRREALVLLIENLLPAAARQNDIRLGRSETAREIIRRLPHGWALLPELKRIVMTEELVQFGGRELPERTFEDCLRRAGPILDAAQRTAA